MSPCLVEARELVKYYRQKKEPALDHLNLTIEQGQIFTLLGRNGAGKTTTLKMFVDLIRSTKGEALINGFNVHTHKKQALESVGSLIETPEIYSSLTPREGLTLIAELRGLPIEERKKRVEEAVAEVRMTDWIDKRVGRFSKGMKQRICIASTLINDPTVILLDEPTSGLDPRGMSEVREIIKTLKGKNRLIFMSSHLLSEVSDVCDEVAMIDHGKLIVYDKLTNVTAKFSGGENVVEVGLIRPLDEKTVTKTVTALPNVSQVEKLDSVGLKITFNGGLEAQERLLSDIGRLNIGAVSFKPASSGLEEAYLKLITATL